MKAEKLECQQFVELHKNQSDMTTDVKGGHDEDSARGRTIGQNAVACEEGQNKKTG